MQNSYLPRIAATPALLAALFLFGCSEPTMPAGGTSRAAMASFSRPPRAGKPMAVEDQKLLAAIRGATARYQNVDAARADGYVDDGFGCIADPTLGGMGWHLINDNLHADPATDPLRPDLLVYEPQHDGKLKLVALEYEVYQADWYSAGHTAPPTLLGQEFEAVDFPPLPLIFGLHVWLWRDNPAGMFADFNPKVACP